MATVPLWYWFAFATLVTVLLVLDLVVFHRKAKDPTFRSAAWGTAMWCSLALGFNLLVFYIYNTPPVGGPGKGWQPAVDFLTGYLVEWSLSVDNVFVFAVIFSFFGVAKKYQYRVLFWGILGAVLMRLVFIVLGTQIIQRYEWVMILFGLFLIYTGYKLATQEESNVDPDMNILLRSARRLFPVSRGEHGERFFIREDGKLKITPLFLVLLVVESTDVMFAVDSVPAILGITRDPFIVFTSNIFAILGLRALYFLLAGAMGMFHYLSYGLSAILMFIGLKMTVKTIAHLAHQHHWQNLQWVEWPLPDWASLVVVLGLLCLSIVASLVLGPRKGHGESDSPPSDRELGADHRADAAHRGGSSPTKSHP